MGSGSVFIFWLLLSIAVGVIAARLGRSGSMWLLTSLLLSPIITGLLLLIAGRASDSTSGKKKCPMCAEWVAEEAIICKHCRSQIGNAPG